MYLYTSSLHREIRILIFAEILNFENQYCITHSKANHSDSSEGFRMPLLRIAGDSKILVKYGLPVFQVQLGVYSVWEYMEYVCIAHMGDIISWIWTELAYSWAYGKSIWQSYGQSYGVPSTTSFRHMYRIDSGNIVIQQVISYPARITRNKG